MASTNVTVTVNNPVSTSVSVIGLGALTGPAPAGETVCAVVVAPSSWVGTLALGGANASSFAISGSNLVVGPSALPAGSYALTITANP